MTKDTFNTIKRDFGGFCSFAIWSEDLNDVDIIEQNVHELHGDIIFVGLNASNPLDTFKNFHMERLRGRDRWLQEKFNNRPFRGAYMTDFFKSDFAKTQNKVKINRETINKGRLTLSKEIELLGNKNPIIVAIGKMACKQVKDSGYKNVECLPHYSPRSGISESEFYNAVSELAIKLSKRS